MAMPPLTFPRGSFSRDMKEPLFLTQASSFLRVASSRDSSHSNLPGGVWGGDRAVRGAWGRDLHQWEEVSPTPAHHCPPSPLIELGVQGPFPHGGFPLGHTVLVGQEDQGDVGVGNVLRTRPQFPGEGGGDTRSARGIRTR